MEKIKRCRKCGARLLEHEKRCPVCGTQVGLDKEVDIIKEEQIIEPEKVDEFIAADKTEQTLLKSNESAQNYWRSKKIWAVFIVLIVVTTVMRQYVINNPIKLAENDNRLYHQDYVHNIHSLIKYLLLLSFYPFEYNHYFHQDNNTTAHLH